MHHVQVAGAFVDGEAKKSAKTKAGLRAVDVRLGALDALKALRAHTKLAGGLVFLNPAHGAQWTGDKPIRERWTYILRRAGVRYRNPHRTRHTYASSLLMLGANPLYVATQLGHVDTTRVFRTYGRWISAGLNNDKRQRLLHMYARTDKHSANEFPDLPQQPDLDRRRFNSALSERSSDRPSLSKRAAILLSKCKKASFVAGLYCRAQILEISTRFSCSTRQKILTI